MASSTSPTSNPSALDALLGALEQCSTEVRASAAAGKLAQDSDAVLKDVTAKVRRAASGSPHTLLLPAVALSLALVSRLVDTAKATATSSEQAVVSALTSARAALEAAHASLTAPRRLRAGLRTVAGVDASLGLSAVADRGLAALHVQDIFALVASTAVPLFSPILTTVDQRLTGGVCVASLHELEHRASDLASL